MSEDIRDTIDVAAILKALEEHIIGARDMNSTQVNAALAILKKAFPDKEVAKSSKNDVLWHEEALKQLD